MKKCALWILLFVAAFPVFAQSSGRVTVSVAAVDGTGSTPEDNDEFFILLNQYLRSHGFILPPIIGSGYEFLADYFFKGSLSPSGLDDGMFDFSLIMENYEGARYEQKISYKTLEEAKHRLPSLLFDMLSLVFPFRFYNPDEELDIEPADPNAWRTQPWYFGAHVFWNPRLYYGRSLETYWFNIGFGTAAEFHFISLVTPETPENEKIQFLKYFAAGMGLELSYDWVIASPRLRDQYWNAIIQIPLTVFGVIRPGEPGNRFLYQPFIGLIFNIPLHSDTVPRPVSWNTGFQYSFKAGEGIFHADSGFAMDFGKSDITAKRLNRNTPPYRRFMFYMGAGYKRDYNLNEGFKALSQKIKDRKLVRQAEKRALRQTGEVPDLEEEEFADIDAVNVNIEGN